MATLTERNYRPDWLFYDEEETRYARENVTILAGSGATRPLTDGMVLAKAEVSSTATAALVAGGTGNGTMGTVTVGAGTKVGVYRAIALAATKFDVFDPTGVNLGVATTGSAFTGGGLTFTITAGGTAFVAGDSFTITTTAATAKYVQIDFSGTLGTQNAAGVLIGDVTAADGTDAAGVALVRGPASIIASKLTWPSGATTNQKNAALAQLLALGIVQRSAA